MYKPMLKSEYLSIWGIDGRTNNDREKDVVPDYSNTKINAERKRVSTIGNVRDVRFALSKYDLGLLCNHNCINCFLFVLLNF